MSLVAWVRPVDWCAKHDIPWASHSKLGVSTDGCGKVDGWVKDWERTKKVGEPPSLLSDADLIGELVRRGVLTYVGQGLYDSDLFGKWKPVGSVGETP